MYTYVYECIHMYMNAYICVKHHHKARKRQHTHIHTHTHTHTHTYIDTYIHTCIHTCIHTYIHTYIRNHHLTCATYKGQRARHMYEYIHM